MAIDIGDVSFTQGPVGTQVTEFGDQQTAKDITALGNVALAAGEGRALAQLEGKSNIFEEVSKEDPSKLDDSLNLTAIAAARKQGRITAEMARVRVNAAVKQAVANNPLFAESIRNDAKKFFQTTTDSDGIFTASTEEALSAAAAKKIQAGQIELEQAAYNANMSVEEYRKTGEILRRGQVATAEKNSKEFLSSSSFDAISGSETNFLAAKQLEFMGNIRTALAQGGLTPQAKANMKFMVQSTVATQIAGLRNLNQNKNITADHRKQLIEQYKSWGDNLNALLDSSDMETIVTEMDKVQSGKVNLAAGKFMGEIKIMEAAGGQETVKWFLNTVGNDKKLAALKAANPQQYQLIQQAGRASEYFAAHVARLNHEEPSMIVPDNSYKGFLTSTLNDPASPNELKSKVADEVQRNVEEGEPEAIGSYLNEGTKAWVMSKPENKQKLVNTVQSMKNSIRTTLREGNVPIDIYDLRFDIDGNVSFERNLEKFQRLQAGATSQRQTPPQIDERFVDNMNLLVGIARKYPGIILQGKSIEDYMRETVGEFSGILKEEKSKSTRQESILPDTGDIKVRRYNNRGERID